VVSIDAAAGCMEVEVRNTKGQSHLQKLGYPAPNDDFHYGWELIGSAAQRASSGVVGRGPKVGPAQCSAVQCGLGRRRFARAG
jgi:hypothetical protein